MSRPKLTPEIAYNLAEALYAASGERDERLESVIAQAPEYACWYARYVLKGPWPEAELVIVQDSLYSYLYAKRVLKTSEDRARFEVIQLRLLGEG